MSKKTYEHPSVEHILASINAFEALEEGKKNLRSFYCRRQTAFSLWSLDKKKNFQFVLTPEVEINRLELKGVNVTEVTWGEDGQKNVEQKPLKIGYNYHVGWKYKELFLTEVNGRAISKSAANLIETTERCPEYFYMGFLLLSFFVFALFGLFLWFLERRRKRKEQLISELLEMKKENIKDLKS